MATFNEFKFLFLSTRRWFSLRASEYTTLYGGSGIDSYPGETHNVWMGTTATFTLTQATTTTNEVLYGDEVMQLYNTDVARTEGFSHANIAEFDGTNYLSIPYTPTLNTPTFTVAVWANTHQLVSIQRMFDSFFDGGEHQDTVFTFCKQMIDGVLELKLEIVL